VTLRDRWAALKPGLIRERDRFFASATLWVSYFMMAWPGIADSLQSDTKWLDFMPAAWHDKSVAVLGGIVWAARMRSRLPKFPTTAPAVPPAAPGP
jgi:hypothetical protein